MTADVLAIDHLIVTTDDLAASAEQLLAATGLAAVPGGRHPGHGTGNWIVPLGDAYVELLAVVDEEEAAGSPFGRFVLERAEHGLAAVCLRTDDATTVAERLGRTTAPMERRTPDGTVLRWRLVGLEDALGPARLPFFIEWEVTGDAHPGSTAAPHRVEPVGITALDLGGDPALVAPWVGEHHLPVQFVGGSAGPRRATIATTGGEVELTTTGLG